MKKVFFPTLFILVTQLYVANAMQQPKDTCTAEPKVQHSTVDQIKTEWWFVGWFLGPCFCKQPKNNT